MKFIFIIIVLLFVFIGYACIIVGARADRRMEKMYDEWEKLLTRGKK